MPFNCFILPLLGLARIQVVVLTIDLHGLAPLSSGSSIELVDCQWFAGISRETSLLVEIGSGLSEK
ncbi:BnaA06g23980D [Brassica napus]|uniref:Secreted protein n=2 Tax=Brassica TaxID=3705 RepID=M4E6E5_BRACM|nr:unnamed protein product [Brassica napus]CDY08826.1 BnaA06g23980D [Brassica napus]